ncbi:MAG: hypothetical protein KGR26_12120 [Cyanobacteria bacterium REEB65]|nr:hypothetical protein [Cyanobacteria bacterium REEB65]
MKAHEDDRSHGRAPARKPRRGTRKDAQGAVGYNPGQVVLLMDLLKEFSTHVEVDWSKQDDSLFVSLQSDLPNLESFIGFKIRDLVSQQDRLAQLWEMSEAG